jgi:hypothetical protein
MDYEEFLYYDTSTLLYAVPAKINLNIKSNGIVVKNGGNSLLIIDGESLIPNESKSFGGNRKEIFTGRHEISFQPQAVQPVPRVDLAVITEKFYVDPEFRQK